MAAEPGPTPPGALSRPRAGLRLQGLLLLLGVLVLGWSLVSLLLWPLLPAARGRELGRRVLGRGARLFWRLTAASGLLHVQAQVLEALRDERGLIVVANHPSLLDAMVMVAQLPQVACVMKAGVLRNPLLAGPALLARYLSNDAPWTLVQGALAELQRGGQLLVFPEGTRTTAPPVGSFSGGFTMIAKRAQVPIQAVFIDANTPYLAKGWPLWRLPPLPMHFSLRLGPRYAPQDEHEALRQRIEADFAAGVRPAPRP